MDFIISILVDFKNNFWLYLSMPIMAALIGYGTKIVAIRMMFLPIEFKGYKPPYLGWQGIIPRRAKEMAVIACDTMTSRLISPKEVFDRLDPERVAKELEKPMLSIAEMVTHQVMKQYQPGLWESLPSRIKNPIMNRIKADTPEIVKQIMDNVKASFHKYFDLKQMVVSSLINDKPLLNRIFQKAGRKEFQFIARSGIYFGFIIGLIQMLTWIFTRSTIIMPIFGLFTGWFTDWLALKMIFRPKEEKTYLGYFKWQGLFLKRRKEVAAEYGALIAKELITPANIIKAVLTGPLSDNLFDMVQRHIQAMIDQEVGALQPIILFAVGSERYQEMKRTVAERVMERLPEALTHVEKYAEDALDIRNTLVNKMQELTPEEFEGLLRPAFQQDEWILIAVGACLGFLVGELQVIIMTH
jgi:uncharacterized membrane protein YheB (UPF0754 family)